VLLSLTAAPVRLPLVPVADLHNTPVVKLNYDAGETIGWPAYVREIANVFACCQRRGVAARLLWRATTARPERSIATARRTGCRPSTAVTTATGIGDRRRRPPGPPSPSVAI